MNVYDQVVLLSGGIDSAVALRAAMDDGDSAIGLFIDYNQKAVEPEACAASYVAADSGIELHIATMRLWQEGAILAHGTVPTMTLDELRAHHGTSSAYLPGRNAVFLSMAAALAEQHKAHTIVLAATREDAAGFPDCRRDFLNMLEHPLAVRILTPLINMSKREVVELGRHFNCPLERTWSCYAPLANRMAENVRGFHGRAPQDWAKEQGVDLATPLDSPCGRCESCLTRAEALDGRG